jgi:hypothetical protein
MGNLSENYNHKDFACKCASCRGSGEYKIHLGLIGALELLAAHFKKRPRIVSGFRCEDSAEKITGTKRSLHSMGKAAHISMEGIPLAELYKFAKEIPEIHGIGLHPKDNCMHLDTRAGDKAEWVKEGDSYNPLTLEKRKQYGLV